MASVTEANGAGEGGREDDLTVIREQTRESLELLRSLVALMLPQGDREGPTLEDLIAALVAQQRQMIAGIDRIEAALQRLVEGADGGRGSRANGNSHPNGYSRS